MLLVDSREPKGMQLLLDGVLAGDTTVTALDSGDYLLFDRDGCSLGIERKSVRDLLASLGSSQSNGQRRIHNQMARMQDAYDHRLLVIEGHWDLDVRTGKVTTRSRPSGWGHSAVQMFVYGLQLHYDIRVLFTGGEGATVDLLRILHERATKGCVLGRHSVTLPSGVTDVEEKNPGDPDNGLPDRSAAALRRPA